jgi:hypothetical protein
MGGYTDRWFKYRTILNYQSAAMSNGNRWWYSFGAVINFAAAFVVLAGLPGDRSNPWLGRIYLASAAFFIFAGCFFIWRYWRAGPIRFSVRQLLVVTTMIAVLLGLLSWIWR